MEIFVRPMRYKGCRQAHNAQVVICALFTTRNSLKLQGRRKVFSPIRKVRAISQKLYSSRQIPIACDAPSRPTSRGFLPWRFADAGPGVRGAVIMGRHPKTFTKADIRLRSMPSPDVTFFVVATSNPFHSHLSPTTRRSILLIRSERSASAALIAAIVCCKVLAFDPSDTIPPNTTAIDPISAT